MNGNWPQALDEEYLVDSFQQTNAIQCFYRTYLGCLLKYGFSAYQQATNQSAYACNIYLPDAPYKSNSLPPLVEDYEIKNAKQAKKYRVCIVYDVIDHLSSLDEIHSFLQSIQLCSRLYLFRCHPYQSRCGTHLTSINKAYFHLFNDIQGRHTIQFPNLDHYRTILSDHFVVLEERRNEEPIEDFFCDDLRRRLEEFDAPHVQTIDFILGNPIAKL